MRSRIGHVAILLLLLTACLAQLAPAQTTAATLSGIVRDTQGGVIPNASITVLRTEAGQFRQTTSGPTWELRFYL